MTITVNITYHNDMKEKYQSYEAHIVVTLQSHKWDNLTEMLEYDSTLPTIEQTVYAGSSEGLQRSVTTCLEALYEVFDEKDIIKDVINDLQVVNI